MGDAPVATDNAYTIAEGGSVGSNLIADDTGNGADNDPNENTLAVTSVTFNNNADTLAPAGQSAIDTGHGWLYVGADGSISFQPIQNFNGTLPSLSYTIDDGHGGTSTATVTITVTPVNDAPTTAVQNIYTTEDTPTSYGRFAASDVDGDPLTHAAGATAAQQGTVTINPDGSFIYTPAANFSGTDVFSYTVTDGYGAPIEALVNVTVLPANDAPQGTDKTVNLPEDTTYHFQSSDFGFSDPNDNPSNNFDKLIITTLPTNGTLKFAGADVAAGQVIAAGAIDQLEFVPDANANGAPLASFTFQLADDGGAGTGNLVANGSLENITFGSVSRKSRPQATRRRPPRPISTRPASMAGRASSRYRPTGTPATRSTVLKERRSRPTPIRRRPTRPSVASSASAPTSTRPTTGLEPGATYTVSGWAIVDQYPDQS